MKRLQLLGDDDIHNSGRGYRRDFIYSVSPPAGAIMQCEQLSDNLMGCATSCRRIMGLSCCCVLLYVSFVPIVVTCHKQIGRTCDKSLLN